MRRTILWKAAIAASATTLALPAAGGDAAWSPPTTVAQGSFSSLGHPLLAGSPRNGATIAWGEAPYDALIARRIRRNGTLGPRRRIARATWFGWSARDHSAIDVGPSGTTVAVWSDPRHRILARRMTRHSRLGRIHVVGHWARRWNGVEVDVALDARGGATIAWATVPSESSQGTSFEGIRVHVRRLAVTGRLGPKIEVPLGGGGNVHPRVVVAPSGRATVVWDFIGPGSAIRAASISRRSHLGPVREISLGTGRAAEPVVDARGRVTAVWVGFVPGATLPYSNALVARQIEPDGAIGPMRVLAAARAPQEFVGGSPHVAVDGAGNATVVWTSGSTTSTSATETIQSRRIGVDGSLSPLTDVVQGLRAAETRLTVDPAGNATVAWLHREPPVENPGYVLQARGIRRDGTLGPVATFASGACPVCFDVSAPKLVADAKGVVTAAWLEPAPRFPYTIKLARLASGR